MSDLPSASGMRDGVTPVVLLCCGSFSPIHNVHLRMFELGRDALHKTGKYEVISGIISPVNDAYVKKDLAPAKHRCAMIRHALRSSNWIRLDTWECDQNCWLETVKVLEHHQQVTTAIYDTDLTRDATPGKGQKPMTKDQEKEILRNYPNARTCTNSVTSRHFRHPVQVKLLLGIDVLETFKDPRLWEHSEIEAIVGKYGVVAKYCDHTAAQKILQESKLLSCYKDNIQFVIDWTYHACSSTKIRNALHKRDSVKYLIDDAVIDYIYTHGLYGTGDKKQPLA